MDLLEGVTKGISDLELLDLLTAPDLRPAKHGIRRRDSDLDPLLLAAVAAYGPHVTRNHYAHDFFPAVGDPRSQGAYDWTRFQGETVRARKPRLKYVSRQAPRSQRSQEGVVDEKKEYRRTEEVLRKSDNLPPPAPRTPPPPTAAPSDPSRTQSILSASHVTSSEIAKPVAEAVKVKCMARTRVPTPHGPVFLHLYHNNRDSKEHLAVVVDPAQLNTISPQFAPPIRSRSLDAVWSDSETEADRITRGAYVGRLSPTSQQPSSPEAHPNITTNDIPSPLIRIHSECFTGETIGSMRCDCGEQLDEAIRQISQPIMLPPTVGRPTTIPGRGAVVYLRQEGRGIGLLSKIRAYNLQDLGHDTVTANLMLGHGADERGYEVAAAILRDLGLGTEVGEGVRLLTNNPDKVQALEKEDIRIVERVPMVPRSWQRRQHQLEHGVGEDTGGLTMIGGGEVHGEDLDKYLRTKVLKMGHMLPLMNDLQP